MKGFGDLISTKSIPPHSPCPNATTLRPGEGVLADQTDDDEFMRIFRTARVSLTTRVMLSLVAGLAIGSLLAAGRFSGLPTVIAIAEPVGGLWLDALRMTIVPLVFGLIVSGVASASDAASAGGLAARALLLFAALLALSGLLAAFATPALLALWPIPAGAAEAFRTGLASSAAAPTTIPPLGEWVRLIVPANPVAAAADGAMLPLVIFSLVFGFAITRIEPDRRRQLTGFCDALVQAMLVIVHWVLLVAPLGVFALALLLGARSGVSAAGGLLHYVLIISMLCLGVIVLLYVGIGLFSRVSVAAFTRAAWPAQAVAVSTQSSLASLPAMVEGVRGTLNVPTAVSNLVLPLGVSLFRITSPVANLGVALYLAHLYGLEVSLFQLAAGVIVASVVSLASVGLPSQVSFFSVVAPVCIAVGAPIEMLGLLLAVESIPDIFRTVGNVTADVAATAILGASDANRA